MMDDDTIDDAPVLAAEYALGLLSPQEAAAFEALLAEDPSLRADYALWVDHLASLTDDIAPVAPPQAILDRIHQAIGPEETEQAPMAPTETSPRRKGLQGWLRNLGLIPSMAAGLAAAMAVLWLVNVSGIMAPSVPFATATLTSEDNSLVVQISYSDNGETLQINRTAGAAPEGKVLELWLLKDDAAPVSLGVLPNDETSTMSVAYALRQLLHGASCALSVEPPGGSPSGAPTGEIVAVAPIVWET